MNKPMCCNALAIGVGTIASLANGAVGLGIFSLDFSSSTELLAEIEEGNDEILAHAGRDVNPLKRLSIESNKAPQPARRRTRSLSPKKSISNNATRNRSSVPTSIRKVVSQRTLDRSGTSSVCRQENRRRLARDKQTEQKQTTLLLPPPCSASRGGLQKDSSSPRVIAKSRNKAGGTNEAISVQSQSRLSSGGAVGGAAENSVVENCPICLEEMKKSFKLDCAHLFHKRCLNTAFKTSAICPLCRTNQSISTRNEISGLNPPRYESGSRHMLSQMSAAQQPNSFTRTSFSSLQCTRCQEHFFALRDAERHSLTPEECVPQRSFLIKLG